MGFVVPVCPVNDLLNWTNISDSRIKFKKGELRLNIDAEFVAEMPTELKDAVCEKKIRLDAEEGAERPEKFDALKFRELINGRPGFYIRNEKAEAFTGFLNEKRESMWLDRIFAAPTMDAMPNAYFGVSEMQVYDYKKNLPHVIAFDQLSEIDLGEWVIVGEPLGETFVAQLRAAIKDSKTDSNFLKVSDTSTYLVKKDETLQKKIEAMLDVVRNNVKDGADPRFKTSDVEMLKYAFRERNEMRKEDSFDRWGLRVGGGFAIAGTAIAGATALAAWGIKKLVTSFRKCKEDPKSCMPPPPSGGSYFVVDAKTLRELFEQQGSKPSPVSNEYRGITNDWSDHCSPVCGSQESLGTNTVMAAGFMMAGAKEALGALSFSELINAHVLDKLGYVLAF